jgi:hypothetical protein
MHKECISCKLVKLEEEFPFANKSEQRRNTKCLDCKRAYDRRYWFLTKAVRNINKGNLRKERALEFVYFLLEFFENNPCHFCGEKDPLVLEFDHIDPSTKIYNIGNMKQAQFSKKTILREIEKCRVLCANCHSKHTAKQRNYRMYQILKEQGKID